jgi:hypothetical protein
MNEKFYLSFENNIDLMSKNKQIFIFHLHEENINCWCLRERYFTDGNYPAWTRNRTSLFKETRNICLISKLTFFKLYNLSEIKRYKINKYLYYKDLFKSWGVYEELCEVLI